MTKLEKVSLDIENLRQDLHLHELIDSEQGVISADALKMSQSLDKLLNEYNNMKKEK